MNTGTPQEMIDEENDFNYKLIKEELIEKQKEFLELSTGDNCFNLNLNKKRNYLYNCIKLLKNKLKK